MEDGGLRMMIRSFRDLEVYRLSLAEARRVFECMKRLPKEEKYSLVDQIRRSSRAVGAMIAEAWGPAPVSGGIRGQG